MTHALLRRLGRDENGVLRAIEIAARIPEHQARYRLGPVLDRFPASPTIAVALVDLALRSTVRDQQKESSHAHLVLDRLADHFEDISGALDLLDGASPAWRWLAEDRSDCASCVADGVAHAVLRIEEIYTRAPDPDVVLSALMSRRRSEYAHRAALRVAARHVLPNAGRARARFAMQKLVDDEVTGAERTAAREIVLACAQDDVVRWIPLVSAAARRGDVETATRILDAKLTRGLRLPTRTLVDLWNLPAARGALVQTFIRSRCDEWAVHVEAAEREGAARGIDMSGMLEAIVLGRLELTSPRPLLQVDSVAHLHRVLTALVREATPERLAQVYFDLEDTFSVSVFCDLLRRQASARVEEVKAAAAKLQCSSPSEKMFFAWLGDIGGIDNS